MTSSDETPAADPAARDRFKDVLAAFERDIGPRIGAAEFAAWDGALQRQILAEKAKAVGQFAAGDYGAAGATLDATVRRAAEALAARDFAFDSALAAAQVAAAGDDVGLATAEIDEALRLRPTSPEAQALRSRIAALPGILDLIARAAVARTENDPESEADWLAQALAADPSRRALADRLDTLREEMRAARFAAAIEAGFAAVARRDVGAARRALAVAEAERDPDGTGRPETKLLAQRIAATARDIEAARLLGKAEQAAAGDDWQSAQTFYEQAAKLLNDDSAALAGAERAQAINALAARLAAHLAAPQRLAAPNIAAQAAALLAQSEASAGLSRRLAGQRAALANALSAWTTKVPVKVVSDGATSVSVRGVGQVGVTTGRTIELSPGTYTFEGARPGYRSKLVAVEIAPGASGLIVEVACDEPV